MELLPTPCPAHLVPDVTGADGVDGFGEAYRQAMERGAVFIAVESQGSRWTVKADTLTAGPAHIVGDVVNRAVRDAVGRLVAAGEVRSDAYAGTVYFVLHGVERQERARELAAALHAALHGDLAPLARAVPTTS
ncbi:hypothetical protein ACIQWN_38850 [Streptomyces vinaceus]|uniref:hypothetical protein n=1 Tax=Streptomyces vinaceus TaxID=1960 RepID=UPI0038300F88